MPLPTSHLRRRARASCAVAAVLVLAACSPTFNWREVPVAEAGLGRAVALQGRPRHPRAAAGCRIGAGRHGRLRGRRRHLRDRACHRRQRRPGRELAVRPGSSPRASSCRVRPPPRRRPRCRAPPPRLRRCGSMRRPRPRASRCRCCGSPRPRPARRRPAPCRSTEAMVLGRPSSDEAAKTFFEACGCHEPHPRLRCGAPGGRAMSEGTLGGRRRVAGVFLAFAFAYFLSTLVRAITATLSPTLTDEFDLESRDLGLLAGGYFLGFAFTQLPMGAWLDRHGPKRVVVAFLGVAVAGCLLFSVATHFSLLLAARVLTGVGVSACLMAPLTGYRRWLSPAMQLRSNSWMLMVGSFGLVGATLPVQWLVPLARLARAVLAARRGRDRLDAADRLGRAVVASRLTRCGGGGSRRRRQLRRRLARSLLPQARADRLLPLRRLHRDAVAVGRALAHAGVGLHAAARGRGAVRHQPWCCWPPTGSGAWPIPGSRSAAFRRIGSWPGACRSRCCSWLLF